MKACISMRLLYPAIRAEERHLRGIKTSLKHLITIIYNQFYTLKNKRFGEFCR